jgi:hypothetical protein
VTKERDRQAEAEDEVERLPGQVDPHPPRDGRRQPVRDHVRQHGEHRRGLQHLQQRVKAEPEGVGRAADYLLYP